MEILDCTLRDGSHALKEPFSADTAVMIIEGLLYSGVKVIEFGKPSGIGSPKGSVPDETYLEAALPYAGRGELGMFCNPSFLGEKEFEIACRYRIGFLRVGTNAANVESAEPVIKKIRQAGIKVRFSLVQAHSVPPKKLAENARKVAGYGAQCVTIMDSTGTMIPSQAKEYVDALVKAGLREKNGEFVTTHSFRHTFASHLIEDGCPIHYVSEMLGHSSVKTTMEVYHHAMPTRLYETSLKFINDYL